jgi:AcrR family transcriptional regulator
MSSKSSSSLSPIDTRSLILEAALRLLTDEGHSALTVRRVATEAGCSTIGVYTWFGGKDGLVDAVWRDGFASFERALRRAKPLDGKFGMLRAQAAAYRKWALRNPRYYRVMFMNAVVDHQPSEELVQVSLAAYLALQNAVQTAANKGELATEDLDAVAMACWGTVHGLVAIELSSAAPPSKSTRQLFERAYDLGVGALIVGFTR